MGNNTELARAMGEDITRMLHALQEDERAVLLFLSGGSALKPLEYVAEDALGGFLTVTMLDERCDPEGEHSNFTALSQSVFFQRAQLCGVQLIDTCVLPSETHHELRARIESDVHAWLLEHPNGFLAATAGVGADGHTAGIMPFPEDPELFVQLFKNEQWFVAYHTGEKNPIPFRVTATITLLQTLDSVFVFATGAEKQNAIARMQSPGSLAECPARILPQLRAKFYLETDR